MEGTQRRRDLLKEVKLEMGCPWENCQGDGGRDYVFLETYRYDCNK